MPLAPADWTSLPLDCNQEMDLSESPVGASVLTSDDIEIDHSSGAKKNAQILNLLKNN